jgi:hypothetical protein
MRHWAALNWAREWRIAMAGLTSSVRGTSRLLDLARRREPTSDVRVKAASVLWFAAATLLVFVAVLLAERRLAGALVAPLDGGTFLRAALGMALLAAAVQLSRLGDIAAKLALAGAAGLALAAVTLPATPPWSVGLGWFVLAATEVAVFLAPTMRWTRATLKNQVVQPTEPRLDNDEQLVQRITRMRSPSGGETIQAVARAVFGKGDRLADVHLAFCPPLDAAPKLTARVIGDSDATATITLAQTYGTRIEVRLPQPAPTGMSILLETKGEAGPAQPAGD